MGNKLETATKTPGAAIKAEMDKRSWTQSDLAKVLGKHQPYINELIQDKRSITPETALALAAAFQNSPEYWLGLDGQYRLSLLEPNTEVGKRSRIFNVAPIRDMQKRGWIHDTDSLDSLEKELLRFFNISNLDEKPRIHINARQPLATDDLSPSQIAWCIRGGRVATAVNASKFDMTGFVDAIPELRGLANHPEKVRHIPKFLAEAGVRLVVVEPLPHSPIDGAAFWLADDAPVILVSARHDRIDCFWHTIAHELSHIRHRDAQSVDSDLVGESSATDLEEIERRANREASDFLIPTDKLDSFIIRVKPFYSKDRIVQFAHRMKVHPGIVAGQLQYRKEIGWYANREMLSKIRGYLIQSAMTDGWGTTVPAI